VDRKVCVRLAGTIGSSAYAGRWILPAVHVLTVRTKPLERRTLRVR